MKVSDGYAMADSRNLPKVDYMMLLQYMRENDTFNVAEIRGAKVLLSTRDAYVETSVGYVEVKRELTICSIKGRVTPEHRVRTKMYTVVASIDEKEEKLMEVMCQDCAASQGGCKHSICFIMWLIKRTEEPSVTSVSCYWTQPKLSVAVAGGKCIMAKEMGKRIQTVQVSNSLNRASFLEECRMRNMSQSLIVNYNNEATESLDGYRIFKLLLEYNSCCTQDNMNEFAKWKEFADSKLTLDIKKNIELKTRTQADSHLWHIMRQGRVTASKIYECTKCNTDGVLVKAILGGYKVPETSAIKRGKRLEKEVVKEIEKSLNIKIMPCGFKLVTPFIGASPDGICEDKCCIVEIKCPSTKKTMENYVKNNVISPKCNAQIQLQMFAMDKERALFCIADPDFEINKRYYEYWVDYDRSYTEKLIADAEVFWINIFLVKL